MLFHRSLLFDQTFFSNLDSNDDGSFLHYEWKKKYQNDLSKTKIKGCLPEYESWKKNYKNEMLCYIKK